MSIHGIMSLTVWMCPRGKMSVEPPDAVPSFPSSTYLIRPWTWNDFSDGKCKLDKRTYDLYFFGLLAMEAGYVISKTFLSPSSHLAY